MMAGILSIILDNPQYRLLLYALIITVVAVGIGWWIKRKFTRR